MSKDLLGESPVTYTETGTPVFPREGKDEGATYVIEDHPPVPEPEPLDQMAKFANLDKAYAEADLNEPSIHQRYNEKQLEDLKARTRKS